MSEKNVDKRVLTDLREWIGVSAEIISDEVLLKNATSIRNMLEIKYAFNDLGEAMMNQVDSFKKQIDSAILLIGESFKNK